MVRRVQGDWGIGVAMVELICRERWIFFCWVLFCGGNLGLLRGMPPP